MLNLPTWFNRSHVEGTNAVAFKRVMYYKSSIKYNQDIGLAYGFDRELRSDIAEFKKSLANEIKEYALVAGITPAQAKKITECNIPAGWYLAA